MSLPGGCAIGARPVDIHLKGLAALGAEIVGVDLREPIDEALKQKLLDAWHHNLVILLRNQTLDEDAQVRFAESITSAPIEPLATP